MSRVFRTHELKQAILEALAEHGPANGYVLMQILAERIGPAWRPSPGAVYPALLALEDLDLIGAIANGGGRSYHLKPAGLAAVAGAIGTLERVADRARSMERRNHVGTLLDRFAATHPARHRRVDDDTEERVEALLSRAAEEINVVMDLPEERT